MNRSMLETITRAAMALTLAAGAAACGNLTAGGIGEASVAMSGDAPDDGATPQMALVSGPATSDHDDDDPEGDLEAEVSVYLVTVDGVQLPLTDGDVRVRVDLEGVQEPEIGSQRVTATGYTTLRMVFSEIEAEVDAGLIIGGVAVTGVIDVDIEQQLTVERSVSLEIEDGERVELLIDLNSDLWLQAVDPVNRTVDAQVFADLVSVRVR